MKLSIPYSVHQKSLSLIGLLAIGCAAVSAFAQEAPRGVQELADEIRAHQSEAPHLIHRGAAAEDFSSTPFCHTRFYKNNLGPVVGMPALDAGVRDGGPHACNQEAVNALFASVPAGACILIGARNTSDSRDIDMRVALTSFDGFNLDAGPQASAFVLICNTARNNEELQQRPQFFGKISDDAGSPYADALIFRKDLPTQNFDSWIAPGGFLDAHWERWTVAPVVSQESLPSTLMQAFIGCINDSNSLSLNHQGVASISPHSFTFDNAPRVRAFEYFSCQGIKAQNLFEAVGRYGRETHCGPSQGLRNCRSNGRPTQDEWIMRVLGRDSQCIRNLRDQQGQPTNTYSCALQSDLSQDIIQQLGTSGP